ncbi:phage portal protein [Bacillus gobiensis]|uniref:phage portal protein n=1 Tax=Bacillus gobiensis TaxID=1441095 RepID=UPI003D190F76
MNLNQYIEKIKNNGITKEIVMELINAHKKDHDRMKKLYERYKSEPEGVPILERKPFKMDLSEKEKIQRIDDKVNNRLANAFDAEIVDTKIGYLFGHPITYEFDDKREPGTTSSIKDMIDSFNLRNHVEDEDSELGKMAAICGKASRLIFIDTEGNERIKNIDPWQVVFLGDNISDPTYTLWYYKDANGFQAAEFYDDSKVYFFRSNESGEMQLSETKAHMFDFNPLFGLANNKEHMGDAERVLTLIDAYNRTLSDASNEIEQYRLAYLILKGMGADEDTLERMKKSGIIELFDEKDDVSYLTKDINDALIEHHLDRLEKNIIRLSKSVNFDDESFSGNSSGVAIKYKLQALENKCITLERKMTSTLRYQFKVLFSAWSKRNGVSIDDYLKVWFGFKRNLPENVLEEAQATAALRGQVSEETRLSKLSFVDDVQFEIRKMQEDQDEYARHLQPLGGEDDNDQEPARAR